MITPNSLYLSEQNVPMKTDLPTAYLLSHFSSVNGSFHHVKALKKGTASIKSSLSHMNVCVCVCERERERESRDRQQDQNIAPKTECKKGSYYNLYLFSSIQRLGSYMT